MNPCHVAVLSLLASSVACSPGPAPVSQSPRDPSNPAAAEGVSPASGATVLVSTSSRAQSLATDAHAGHDHAGAAAPGVSPSVASADAGSIAITYTCPMHPQITSAVPGQCPICGMNLVPKK